jgi:hypothetical protein
MPSLEVNDYLSYEQIRRRLRFKLDSPQARALRSLLYAWHDTGCIYLNGEKLNGRQEMRAVAKGNGHRRIWVYDPQQIERVSERMRRERSGIFEDEDGTWLTAVAAKKSYGIWDASLGDWRTEPCPFLGRTITYKPLRRFWRSGRYRSRYLYLETDLEKIAAAQAASTGAATYQDAEGIWLFAREVAARTDWPADGLYYYRKKKWPCLPSGKLRAKQVAAKHHPHYPRISRDESWVYHAEDVERIAAYRRGVESPGSDQSSNTTDNRTSSSVDPPSPFISSPLQSAILALLGGKSMIADELEVKLKLDRRRLYYGGTIDARGGLMELIDLGLVASGKGQGIRGYYRPDCPPISNT